MSQKKQPTAQDIDGDAEISDDLPPLAQPCLVRTDSSTIDSRISPGKKGLLRSKSLITPKAQTNNSAADLEATLNAELDEDLLAAKKQKQQEAESLARLPNYPEDDRTEDEVAADLINLFSTSEYVAPKNVRQHPLYKKVIGESIEKKGKSAEIKKEDNRKVLEIRT